MLSQNIIFGYFEIVYTRKSFQIDSMEREKRRKHLKKTKTDFLYSATPVTVVLTVIATPYEADIS